MSVEDLGKFLPVILINKQYIITSVNETAKTMLGDVVGKRCYQVLYNLDKPCPEFDIKCPIVTGEEDIDTVTLDFEVYLRSFGKLPVGGMYWESVVNITNLSVIRSGVFDPLTGLYSRSFVKGMVEKLFYMWKRYGEVFSLLYIDLDDLRRINKEFGNLTGDEAIKKVGQCAKLYSRKADVSVRYGNDEFLVILPKTKREESLIVAKRILRCVKELPFVTRLSVTIGLTQVSEGDRKVEDIYERVSEAMLYAKSHAKGHIAMDEGEDKYKIVK